MSSLWIVSAHSLFLAVFGFSLVFFYISCRHCLFFIPTALVSAELGTGWPNRGGIYVWVREAFGKKFSFFIIWLIWIFNVIWYPDDFSLNQGTFSYFLNPELGKSYLYVLRDFNHLLGDHHDQLLGDESI